MSQRDDPLLSIPLPKVSFRTLANLPIPVSVLLEAGQIPPKGGSLLLTEQLERELAALLTP